MFHVEHLDDPGQGGRRPLRRAGLLALVLVPVLLAGLLLGTAWGRDSRLHRITAAVVNNDKAVTVNGQTVPLGREMASEIVSKPSQNVNWVLSDTTDAADGLATGRYAAVVTIPEDFSADATSLSKASSAQQATVDVETSPAASVEDAQIARQVAATAMASTNAVLTSGYLDKIYLGFNQMGSQLVTMGKGAQQLANGADQLSTGTTKATSGVTQLGSGLQQLDASGSKLTSGATQLQTGAGKLSSGITQYTAGASKVVDGIGQLSSGISRLDAGLQGAGSSAQFAQLGQLKTGAAQVASGAAGLSNGITAYQAQLDAWAKGTSPMPSQVSTAYSKQFIAQCTAEVQQQAKKAGTTVSTQLSTQVQAQVKQQVQVALAEYQKDSPTPLTPQQVKDLTTRLDKALSGAWLQQALSDQTMVTNIAQQLCPAVAKTAEPVFQAGFQAGTATASAALDHKDARTGQSLKSGAAALASGAGQLSAGVTKLVDALPGQIKAQMAQLSSAVAQLDAGAKTLATRSQALKSGGSQLATAAQQLSAGAGSYAAGVTQYTAGVHQASTGAQQLGSGMTQLSSGSAKLAQGMDTFATKVSQGATKVPNYSAGDRERLSTVAATPVTGATDHVASPLQQLTALLLVLGAWLGSMLTWVVARPVASRVLTSSRPSWQLAGATMAPGALVGLGQGLLLGILGSIALHLGFARGLGLTAFLLLVGLAFTAINHALAVWLGGVGRTIGLLLATVTAAVGTVSAVPGVFSTIHGASPLAPALTGVRRIVTHASLGLVPVGGLVLLGLLAALLVLLQVVRQRRISVESFRHAERLD